MRIRIALSTALAVIAVPSVLFTLFSITPAAAAKGRHETGTRHRVVSHAPSAQHRAVSHKAGIRHRAANHNTRHRAVRIDSRATSYSKAQKAAAAQQAAAAQLAAYASAVTKAQEENFLKEYAFLQEYSYLKALAYLNTLAAHQAAAARAQAAAASTPAPAPAAGGSDATSTNTADWACIRQHESGGNYSVGGGGAYQFELGTWSGLTGLGTPAQDSPPAVQDAAALRLYAERGWEPWTTRFVCGL